MVLVVMILMQAASQPSAPFLPGIPLFKIKIKMLYIHFELACLFCRFLIAVAPQWQPSRRMINSLCWVGDFALGMLLLLILFVGSLFGLLTRLQAAVLFSMAFANSHLADENLKHSELGRLAKELKDLYKQDRPAAQNGFGGANTAAQQPPAGSGGGGSGDGGGGGGGGHDGNGGGGGNASPPSAHVASTGGSSRNEDGGVGSSRGSVQLADSEVSFSGSDSDNSSGNDGGDMPGQQHLADDEGPFQAAVSSGPVNAPAQSHSAPQSQLPSAAHAGAATLAAGQAHSPGGLRSQYRHVKTPTRLQTTNPHPDQSPSRHSSQLQPEPAAAAAGAGSSGHVSTLAAAMAALKAAGAPRTTVQHSSSTGRQSIRTLTQLAGAVAAVAPAAAAAAAAAEPAASKQTSASVKSTYSSLAAAAPPAAVTPAYASPGAAAKALPPLPAAASATAAAAAAGSSRPPVAPAATAGGGGGAGGEQLGGSRGALPKPDSKKALAAAEAAAAARTVEQRGVYDRLIQWGIPGSTVYKDRETDALLLRKADDSWGASSNSDSAAAAADAAVAAADAAVEAAGSSILAEGGPPAAPGAAAPASDATMHAGPPAAAVGSEGEQAGQAAVIVQRSAVEIIPAGISGASSSAGSKKFYRG